MWLHILASAVCEPAAPSSSTAPAPQRASAVWQQLQSQDQGLQGDQEVTGPDIHCEDPQSASHAASVGDIYNWVKCQKSKLQV